jgi:hypothetical protein
MPTARNNNGQSMFGKAMSSIGSFATGFFADTPAYEPRLDAAALLQHLHVRNAIPPLIACLRQMPNDANIFYEAQDYGGGNQVFRPWREMLRPGRIRLQPTLLMRRPATTVWDNIFIQTLQFKPRGEGEEDGGYSEYQLAHRRFGNSTSVGKLAYSEL